MWGHSCSETDKISSEMTSAIQLGAPWDGNIDGIFPSNSIDSREIFYTHSVAATPSLCVPCFDALLRNFRDEEYVFPNPRVMHCPMFVRWEKIFADDEEQAFVRGLSGE